LIRPQNRSEELCFCLWFYH